MQDTRLKSSTYSGEYVMDMEMVMLTTIKALGERMENVELNYRVKTRCRYNHGE